jgi:hypothetical protein
MSNHTPGPWKVSRRFDVYQDTQVPGVGGTFVASTKGISELPESINQVCEADAKLIAAAPELLAALERIVDAERLTSDRFRQAREAIRKAKGESE